MNFNNKSQKIDSFFISSITSIKKVYVTVRNVFNYKNSIQEFNFINISLRIVDFFHVLARILIRTSTYKRGAVCD